jgi:hypothetical protein
MKLNWMRKRAVRPPLFGVVMFGLVMCLCEVEDMLFGAPDLFKEIEYARAVAAKEKNFIAVIAGANANKQ